MSATFSGLIETILFIGITPGSWLNHVYTSIPLVITTTASRVLLGSISTPLTLTTGFLKLVDASFETLLTLDTAIDAIPSSDINIQLCLVVGVDVEGTWARTCSIALEIQAFAAGSVDRSDLDFGLEDSEITITSGLAASVLTVLTIADAFSVPIGNPDVVLSIIVEVTGEVDRCQP